MRQQLDPDALGEAAVRVAEAVLALPELGEPTVVSVYLSVRRELPTAPLLAGLVAEGHRVAVPRVEGQDLQMRAWSPEAYLLDGVLGIPTTDGPVVPGVAVAICPGLGFDAAGRRLGYGGGYYDRWLSASGALAIGVCVDEALLDAVPAGEHDVAMALVVTPSRTIRVGGGPPS
ncbi:MAG: 5-formyltetrahydrofolate cyclo-ligase [Myxococcota bacterium]